MITFDRGRSAISKLRKSSCYPMSSMKSINISIFIGWFRKPRKRFPLLIHPSTAPCCFRVETCTKRCGCYFPTHNFYGTLLEANELAIWCQLITYIMTRFCQHWYNNLSTISHGKTNNTTKCQYWNPTYNQHIANMIWDIKYL